MQITITDTGTTVQVGAEDGEYNPTVCDDMLGKARLAAQVVRSMEGQRAEAEVDGTSDPDA